MSANKIWQEECALVRAIYAGRAYESKRYGDIKTAGYFDAVVDALIKMENRAMARQTKRKQPADDDNQPVHPPINTNQYNYD